MEPYQQRVVDEKRELDEKLDKLTAYMMSVAVNRLRITERNLLLDQARVMRQYSSILGERIALFTRRAAEA